jgi:hypothetical protein
MDRSSPALSSSLPHLIDVAVDLTALDARFRNDASGPSACDLRLLGLQVSALRTQVLLTCGRLGLSERTMFAVDGIKLPAGASKQRCGTHAELTHRANRLDKAAAKVVALHQAQDEHGATLDNQRQAPFVALVAPRLARSDLSRPVMPHPSSGMSLPLFEGCTSVVPAMPPQPYFSSRHCVICC